MTSKCRPNRHVYMSGSEVFPLASFTTITRAFQTPVIKNCLSLSLIKNIKSFWVKGSGKLEEKQKNN